jgi:hypothetical protein
MKWLILVLASAALAGGIALGVDHLRQGAEAADAQDGVQKLTCPSAACAAGLPAPQNALPIHQGRPVEDAPAEGADE